MEKQTEKIKRFSKVISVLLNIATIVFIVLAVAELLAWVWTTKNLGTEIVTINGVDMNVPLLFKIGNTSVCLPIMWKSGYDFLNANGFVPIVGLTGFLSTIFTLVGLRFVRKVFKLLRENGSPFRDDVIKALKRLAIVLLVVGCVSGLVAFIAAGVVWVLCLIFDYGRSLQNESDTTL
ncbi:MAG: hypothetical protein FWG61_09960 [Firmicutes bacterium]|nr:hypothetical protein [Bacillota bacterium]